MVSSSEWWEFAAAQGSEKTEKEGFEPSKEEMSPLTP
jgi:hypothetical protein